MLQTKQKQMFPKTHAITLSFLAKLTIVISSIYKASNDITLDLEETKKKVFARSFFFIF